MQRNVGASRACALQIAVVLLGVANVWIGGDTLFNGFKVPALPTPDPNGREQVVDLHGLATSTLPAIVALHALAASWDHIARHDGMRRRMWPR